MKKILLFIFLVSALCSNGQWSILRSRTYSGPDSSGFVGISKDSAGFLIVYHLPISSIKGGGSGSQVNSDWNASSGVAQILNKPTIPAAQINTDWNSSSGLSQLLNKPNYLDSFNLSTRKWRDKGIDSVVALINAANASIATKQPQLNGTGFVKVSGTTISYDNTSYLSSIDSGNISNFYTKARASLQPIAYSTVPSGITKGNGSILNAATSGTDFAPGTSSLGTGILKSTTSTGALSIAVAGDFPTLNQNTSGSAASISASHIITNANMVQMSANTFKANNTGSTSDQTDITATQAKTLLAITESDVSSLTTDLNAKLTNPLTTLGDIIYENATPTPTRLAGNTTTTNKFLTQTGNGSISAAPGWNTIQTTDVPTLNQNTSGSAASVSGTNVITNGNFRQSAANSVVGNNTSSTTNVTDISAGTDGMVLSRKSGVIGFNQLGGLTAITAVSGAINTTETNLTNFTLPANILLAGTTFKVTIFGTCTSTVANASNIRVRIGTANSTADNIGAVLTPTAAASGTNIPFQAILFVTIRTTGSGGTMGGNGALNNNGVTGISAAADVIGTPQSAIAVNTTVQNTISVWYVSAATTTTSTFQIATIELIKM